MRWIPVLLLLLIIFSSCKWLKRKHAARDTTITGKTSFNNLFLDSAAVANFIERHPEFSDYEDQFLDFYEDRNYEYAWFDSSGLSEQAHNFANLLNSAIGELHDSSLYHQDFNDLYMAAADTVHRKKKSRLETELFFTGEFFAYTAHVYNGSDIDAAQLGWFIPRKKVDLSAVLDSALRTNSAGSGEYAPLNPQYKKLAQSLATYYDLQKKDRWDSIPRPARPIKKTDSTAVIGMIKKRLSLLGDLTVADSSFAFDSALVNAARHFQLRMGMAPDGIISAKMVDELNVTPRQRIRQLLINMERARWMPPENDTNFIVVNIPEYKMHVYDQGRQVFDMNVIVGTTANSTVIFKGNLKFIVFSPYWNVPTDIVQREILPSIKKNSNYIQKSNMEITGYSNGIPEVRQKPGPSNSLGLVKFLFPNNYNIYFHDTPNHELFSQSSRSFSHGCIRLGEPKHLAEYLLRTDPAWNSDNIDSAMHQDKEKWVTLDKTIPVFITYFTAWVDTDGQLNFRKDIYGHDAKMAAKLFAQ